MAGSPGKQSLWGRFWQMLITWTVYFLFRPKIIYANKTLKKRLKGLPCVYVANHTHHFDGAFCGAVLWRYKPWVLVKRSWYEKKRTGKFIAWCRTVPISLDEPDGEWFEISERIVKNGGSLMIFPEGGLSRDGRLGEFKPGAALISAKTGVPIVPCAVYGTYSSVFGMRQKILIGEPIESRCPEDMRHSKYARQLIEKSRGEVWQLYGSLLRRFGDCGTYLPEETAGFNSK
ncbi:MAG: 1-acyl-sn-glycerol-3-phosphate acyltransferase [Oscillospiraceae bacterium]|nr:1-acyl-sn-glycerol-3-phosphate acyltransferase [Oscillospiraceae bacterium]